MEQPHRYQAVWPSGSLATTVDASNPTDRRSVGRVFRAVSCLTQAEPRQALGPLWSGARRRCGPLQHQVASGI